MDFLDWFTYSDNTIDGQSRKKAYTLWESNLVADKDVDKVKALQQIHELLKGALTDKINDCEIFMKGIDYSYYYEQEE